METLELFGKRLKEVRKSRHLTQERLAEIINIDTKQVCRIENGSCFTTFETLQKISTALSISLYELFNYEHKKSKDILIEEINEILNKMSENNIELVHKIVNAISQNTH